jgi:hypothetical protein
MEQQDVTVSSGNKWQGAIRITIISQSPCRQEGTLCPSRKIIHWEHVDKYRQTGELPARNVHNFLSWKCA